MKTRKKSSQHSAVSTQPKTEGKRQETHPNKPRRGKYELQELTWPDQRVVRFPHVQGKTAESIELLSSARYHHITVEFADKTSLSFAIEPRFVVKAAYEFLRKGEPCAKLWPDIGSQHSAVSGQQTKTNPLPRIDADKSGSKRAQAAKV
jgi:hypothetical protein